MADLTTLAPVRLVGLRPGPATPLPAYTGGPVQFAPGPPGPAGEPGDPGSPGPAGPANLSIGSSAPTPPAGESVLWVDTTGGNVTLNLVTGD